MQGEQGSARLMEMIAGINRMVPEDGFRSAGIKMITQCLCFFFKWAFHFVDFNSNYPIWHLHFLLLREFFKFIQPNKHSRLVVIG